MKQTEYRWAYVSAAVNPATGQALGVITPDMDTSVMNDLLCNLSRMLGADRHAVLVWDGAGYHTRGGLEVLGNITLLPLPPYSPELSFAERVRLWMRSHDLSNRAYEDQAHVERALAEICSRLHAARLQSICRTDWLDRSNQVEAE